MAYKDAERGKVRQRESGRRWRESHREEAKAYSKVYYQTNKKEVCVKGRVYWKKNKEIWTALLSKLGRDFCTRCGYGKCFAALDFHHINSENKKMQISLFWKNPITMERLEELDKTITLCSNCHRELHDDARGE